jgi:hypothetical protein
MVRWKDEPGEKYIQDYCDHYSVPPGWSVTGHFFEACGLTELAEKAWRTMLVRGVYAAIFAVRNDRLALIPKKRIPRMRKLACAHPSVGFVFERLWLHLFGLPFINLEQVAALKPAEENRPLTSVP